MNLRSIDSLSVAKVGVGCNNFGMRLDAAETAVVLRKAPLAVYVARRGFGGSVAGKVVGEVLGSGSS